MTETNQKKNNKNWPVYIILFLLIGIVGFVAYKKNNNSKLIDEKIDDAQAMSNSKSLSENNAPNLTEIIKSRQTWDVLMPEWIGKPVANFTVSKIDGSKYSISEHNGKDILIIFWATWCVYCVNEIPHLNALINDMPDSEFSLIAISDEKPDTLKSFGDKKGIKYNSAVSEVNFRNLPEPLNSIYQHGRPAAAFIDKQGKIKLMTIGTMSLTEIKQIIKAEPYSQAVK